MKADYEDSAGLTPRLMACEARVVSRNWRDRAVRRGWDLFKLGVLCGILIFCFGGLLGAGPWAVEIGFAALILMVHASLGRFFRKVPRR